MTTLSCCCNHILVDLNSLCVSDALCIFPCKLEWRAFVTCLLNDLLSNLMN